MGVSSSLRYLTPSSLFSIFNFDVGFIWLLTILTKVEMSVVDIPFASCAFPPVQFDSNLTRQIFNNQQGVADNNNNNKRLSADSFSTINNVNFVKQEKWNERTMDKRVSWQVNRWMAACAILHLQHLLQSGDCALHTSFIHPGAVSSIKVLLVFKFWKSLKVHRCTRNHDMYALV